MPFEGIASTDSVTAARGTQCRAVSATGLRAPTARPGPALYPRPLASAYSSSISAAGAATIPYGSPTLGLRQLADVEAGPPRDQRAGGDVPRVDAALVVRVEATARAPDEIERGGTDPSDVPHAGQHLAQHVRLAGAHLRVIAEAGRDHRGRQVRRAPTVAIGSPFSVGDPDRVASKRSSRIGSSTTPATVPAASSQATLTRERRDSEQIVDRPVERVDDPAQASAPPSADPSVAPPSSPRIASPGRCSARTRRIAGSAATSASDTRSVGVLFVCTPWTFVPNRGRSSSAAASAAASATASSARSWSAVMPCVLPECPTDAVWLAGLRSCRVRWEQPRQSWPRRVRATWRRHRLRASCRRLAARRAARSRRA